MKLKNNSKKVIIEIICLLYVLLFVYAAVSKILDFESFQVQLGQSPLISAFASWVSWSVPIAEIIITLALISPKFRSIGLLCAFSLMTMFTAYIFIILHYSSFVPCSCGGVLEKMTWDMHLVFNIIFVVLAALAIVLHFKTTNQKRLGNIRFFPISSISITFISSTVIIILLFLFSEDIMQHKNPFIRRYPQHPIMLDKNIDLKFNSYYFAGYANNRIYLGNYTDPLHLLSLDASLQNKKTIKITFEEKTIPFKMVTIAVKGSYFYLMDGTVPCIFRGKISDWKITTKLKGVPRFTIAEPLDSTTVALRSIKGKNSAHILGVFNSDKTPKIKYNEKLLEKQIDGVFDTDGMLINNEKEQRMVYLYYYRNEFIIADKNADLIQKGHTIDTISKAQIKVAYLKDGTQRKMVAPPLMVNKSAFVYSNLLFVESNIPGRFDKKKLWKQAVIIDVYNLEKSTYQMSFAVYNIEDKKLQSLFVTSTHLYAIINNNLVGYTFRDILKKEMK